MQVDTARMLLDSIATALNLASDNQCKLVALEKLLKDQNPELFEAYTKNLETLRRNPPTSISLAGFANLQTKLVQD